MNIRKAIDDDKPQVWEIIRHTIAGGDTYTFAPASSREKMLSYWFADDKETFVAVEDDQVLGTFIIKENQPDLGSHIANASYMVSPNHAGRGIGRAMGEFSLEEAKKMGYHAMQFNIVVESNETAINLWKKLGFTVIGEIPEAFRHKTLGLTNAYIMYKKLG